MIRPTRPAQHSERIGDKSAYVDDRRAVTYRELELRTARLAGHPARLGVRRGDRVAIHLGNRVELVEAWLGVLRAGAIGVLLNSAASEEELAYFLDDCGAVAVVTEEPVAQPAAVRRVIVVGREEPVAGALGFEDLAATDSDTAARDDLGLDEPAWIHCTQGTTGQSKGVVSTQRSALWSVAKAYVPAYGLEQQDRLLWPLPMFHALDHSGIDHGEAVPRDLETLIASHAATVRHQLGDRPYAVVGHSMGGSAAHALTAHLAALGAPPAGLVLIDSYHITPDREAEPWLLSLPARIPLAAGERFDTLVDDLTLPSLGAYTRSSVAGSPNSRRCRAC